MHVPNHRQLDAAAPRYTSYPTAPHFGKAVGPDTVARWLSDLPRKEAVSLYVHVPYCDRLCWFCACHTKQTLRYEPVARFLEGLRQEIRLLREFLPGRLPVNTLHFGGGSPTMLRPDDMRAARNWLDTAFDFDGGSEICIEADPNDMDGERFAALAEIGVTRASLGVQDFDPRVQKAINRDQTFEVTRATVEGFRESGVRSINLDLLYGLPHQSVDTLRRTLDLSLLLDPDRIALFGYAHVPWFKTHQRLIPEAALPDGRARFEQSRLAAAAIASAGYEPIGIDHFAKPGDSLAVAARSGRLRRNFQGYTDDACETLIGLGPSSISRFRQGYAQTEPATGSYLSGVSAGRLATVRGLAFSDDDRIRGWLIERLMCDFAICDDDLRQRFGDAGMHVLEAGIARAAATGLHLLRDGGRWVVLQEDRPLVRLVASAFDRYFEQDEARHSRVV